MRQEAKNRIEELTDRFRRNVDVYKNGAYNETQVRREFIDPFFEALGWDVANKAGYAEQYKDVVHEDSIKVGVSLKAPDYSFRIGGQRKFFLEAKKPQVKIKEDVGPAYQLRRYAWSAKLPLSIVTDFEEFAVYDCRTKPNPSDKVSLGRIAYYTYDQYLDKFDEIYDTFSKDAVLKGSFDRYIESTKVKKGTGEVDREFLKEIEKWRDSLARNLALRNPELDIYELNFAVQHTIDRIIFLRICEDRGIEGYGRLQGLSNGANAYERLLQLFTQADKKYNSGLFDFKADKLSHNLKIDDKVLKEIIENLYYPKSPYEFSVLGAEILGNVYEQFLGKVIRLTAGHQAKVEEKPEVKKAGGVYYTPQYIVEYIVKNTVGRLVGESDGSVGAALRGRPDLEPAQTGQPHRVAPTNITPKDVSKIRILDPACGSGSFLIGAYQYLLDWHLKWYRDNDAEKHARGKTPAVYLGAGKEWRLTTQEKKRILLNNIYGVDIDRQAVEVTKLSLLLKLLEDENQETVGKTLALFQERVLPSLENNIKCGNSLIGPDFYNQMELNVGAALGGRPIQGNPIGKGTHIGVPLQADDIRRINVFDWEKEFPEIMKTGGFDAVIGNPPYGIPFTKTELSYLNSHYPQTTKFPDSYCLFMVAALQLAKEKGYASFIIPNTFCDLESCDNFRMWLLSENNFLNIWQTGWAFQSAVVDTLVFIAKKERPEKHSKILIQVDEHEYQRLISDFLSNDLHKIDYRLAEEDKIILDKITSNSRPLQDFATVKAGVKLYEKGKGVPPQTEQTLESRPFTIKGECPNGWKILYRGEDIGRYKIEKPKEYVHYGPWIAAPRSPDLFENHKILMRRTDYRLLSSIESESAICVNSCHVIKLRNAGNKDVSYNYLLGLLNSKLLQHIFEIQNPQMVNKVFAEIKVVYVERLPIRTIDFNNPTDKALHDKMVSLVDRMLDLNKKLQTVKIAHEKELLERQIKITDGQIDQLVYELYGLTEEEIGIVES